MTADIIERLRSTPTADMHARRLMQQAARELQVLRKRFEISEKWRREWRQRFKTVEGNLTKAHHNHMATRLSRSALRIRRLEQMHAAVATTLRETLATNSRDVEDWYDDVEFAIKRLEGTAP
jgi:hypothetical protein